MIASNSETQGASRDRWFHDEHGRLVIWQVPNLPLIVWGVCRLLALVARRGVSGRLVDTLAFGALFTWAWLELTAGSAHVRRVFGAVVLVALVYNRAWQ